MNPYFRTIDPPVANLHRPNNKKTAMDDEVLRWSTGRSSLDLDTMSALGRSLDDRKGDLEDPVFVPGADPVGIDFLRHSERPVVGALAIAILVDPVGRDVEAMLVPVDLDIPGFEARYLDAQDELVVFLVELHVSVVLPAEQPGRCVQTPVLGTSGRCRQHH